MIKLFLKLLWDLFLIVSKVFFIVGAYLSMKEGNLNTLIYYSVLLIYFSIEDLSKDIREGTKNADNTNHHGT